MPKNLFRAGITCRYQPGEMTTADNKTPLPVLFSFYILGKDAYEEKESA